MAGGDFIVSRLEVLGLGLSLSVPKGVYSVVE